MTPRVDNSPSLNLQWLTILTISGHLPPPSQSCAEHSFFLIPFEPWALLPLVTVCSDLDAFWLGQPVSLISFRLSFKSHSTILMKQQFHYNIYSCLHDSQASNPFVASCCVQEEVWIPEPCTEGLHHLCHTRASSSFTSVTLILCYNQTHGPFVVPQIFRQPQAPCHLLPSLPRNLPPSPTTPCPASSPLTNPSMYLHSSGTNSESLRSSFSPRNFLWLHHFIPMAHFHAPITLYAILWSEHEIDWAVVRYLFAHTMLQALVGMHQFLFSLKQYTAHVKHLRINDWCAKQKRSIDTEIKWHE